MNSTDLYSNGASEVFTFESGVERMMVDLEEIFYPRIAAFRPLLSVFANIAFVIIPIVFLVFASYILFVKKHRVLNKFKNPKNYIWYATFIVLYLMLSYVEYSFGYGLNLNLGRVILPCAAKFFGPCVGGVFAMIIYLVSCLQSTGSASFLGILTAAVSGMIYGLIFYRKRTRYSRCLGCKIVVGLFCNTFLSALALYNPAVDIVAVMVNSVITSIIMSPVSAAGIYLSFKLVRLIKKAYSV